jgi:hypothetical protein
MKLPLQKDNSSMIINLHRCFGVGAHFVELDNFYQMLSFGTKQTGDKFKKDILPAVISLSLSLHVIHLKEQIN